MKYPNNFIALNCFTGSRGTGVGAFGLHIQQIKCYSYNVAWECYSVIENDYVCDKLYTKDHNKKSVAMSRCSSSIVSLSNVITMKK